MGFASFEYNLRNATRASEPSYVKDYNQRRARNPVMPSYDPSSEDLEQKDLEYQNWNSNLESAKSGAKIADFLVNKLPDYDAAIDRGIRNRDYQTVSSLVDEVSSFFSKHDAEIAPWGNLQNNGDQGRALSARVRAWRDGSRQYSPVSLGVSGDGKTQFQTNLWEFMHDQSEEGKDARAEQYARSRGIRKELARQMTDETADFHKVFADDAKNYDMMSAASAGQDSEQLRVSDSWSKDKFELVNRYRDQWQSQDEAADFFKAWESKFSRTRNGGISLAGAALKQYMTQRSEDASLSPHEFVSLYSDSVDDVTPVKSPASTVRRDGTVATYDMSRSPVDYAKAHGLVRAAVDIGSKLGVSVDEILRNDVVRSSLRSQYEELSDINDRYGFDIYNMGGSPSSDAAESALAKAGIPGAVDRLGFVRDGAQYLEGRIYSQPETAVVDGKQVVTRDRSDLHIVERPLAKAVSSVVTKYREGNESWSSALERVRSDPKKTEDLKSAMSKAFAASGMSVGLQGALTDAYLGNLFGTGPKTNVYEVLNRIAGNTTDPVTGETVTSAAQRLQMKGLRLGAETEGPAGTRIEMTASGNLEFLANLDANTSAVMPRLSGEPSGNQELFKDLAVSMKSKNREEIAKSSLKLAGDLTGSTIGFDWVEDRSDSTIRSAAKALAEKDPDNSSVVIQMAALVSGAKSDWATVPRSGIGSGTPGGSALDVVISNAKDLWSNIRGQDISETDDASEIRRTLEKNGFFTGPRTIGNPMAGFDFKTGMAAMLARDPSLAENPMFAYLVDPKTLEFSPSADRLLLSEQRRRLASDVPARSVRSQDTPEMSEARRMLQVYGGKDSRRDASQKLMAYCTSECGDDKSALSMYQRAMQEYAVRESKGESEAARFLTEFTSRRFRYVNLLDANGNPIAGKFHRTKTRMNAEEFRRYQEEAGAYHAKNGIPNVLTEADYNRGDAEGREVFFDALKNNQEIQRQMTLRDYEYGLKLKYAQEKPDT